MSAPLRAQTYSSRSDVATAISSGYSRADVTPLLGAGNNSLLTRMVWAHSIPNDDFLYQASAGTAGVDPSFGSHFDQALLAPGVSTTDAMEIAKDAALKAQGVDGLSIDRFTDPSFFAAHIRCADAAGIKLMPCVDLSLTTPSSYVSATTSYYQGWYTAATSGTHPSVMMIGSAYAVASYQQHTMTPTQWGQVRANLLAAGMPIYLVGDVSHPNYPSGSAFSSGMASDLSACDMGYWFGYPANSYDYSRMVAAFVASGKPFALPLQPGYARQGQTFTDAAGDTFYENGWQQDLLTEAQYPGQCLWAHISTADDIAEDTDIVASSDKGDSLMTMTGWYAAQFKHQACPITSPLIVVHVPQSIYTGGTATAYVRAYNPRGTATLLNTFFYDPFGSPAVEQQNTPIQPQSTLFQTFRLTLNSSDSSNNYVTLDGTSKTLRLSTYGQGYYNLSCTLKDDISGSTIASVNSAPTALYTTTYPGSVLRTLYYSSTSGETIAGPTAYIHQPTTGTYTGSMSAAAGTTAKLLWFTHDTRIVRMAYGTNSIATGTSLPAASVSWDDRQDSTDHQYFYAWEQDTNGNIGVTGPIQVPTPGN